MSEVIVLTKDELVEIIEETIHRVLTPQRGTEQIESDSGNQDEWLSRDDLMDYIPSHPSRQTIYRWTMNKTIPFHKRGKSLLFKKSEINKWLDDSRRKTNEEIREEARQHINRRSA